MSQVPSKHLGSSNPHFAAANQHLHTFNNHSIQQEVNTQPNHYTHYQESSTNQPPSTLDRLKLAHTINDHQEYSEQQYQQQFYQGEQEEEEDAGDDDDDCDELFEDTDECLAQRNNLIPEQVQFPGRATQGHKPLPHQEQSQHSVNGNYESRASKVLQENSNANSRGGASTANPHHSQINRTSNPIQNQQAFNSQVSHQLQHQHQFQNHHQPSKIHQSQDDEASSSQAAQSRGFSPEQSQQLSQAQLNGGGGVYQNQKQLSQNNSQMFHPHPQYQGPHEVPISVEQVDQSQSMSMQQQTLHQMQIQQLLHQAQTYSGSNSIVQTNKANNFIGARAATNNRSLNRKSVSGSGSTGAGNLRSSKSQKNFHSVVGNSAYNQLMRAQESNINQQLVQNPTLNPQQQQTADEIEGDKDFKRAYLKLVKKMYQETGQQNLLITQEELEKVAYQQQCLSLQDFNQRNQQCLENKQQKTKILQELKQQAELQECTFKPQTYSQKERRNLDQFLKDQQQYELIKQQKNKQRQEHNLTNEQQQLKHAPRLNKKSQKIVEQKKKQAVEQINDLEGFGSDVQNNIAAQKEMTKPVFERLHNIHHEKQQRLVQRQIEHTNFLTGKTKEVQASAAGMGHHQERPGSTRQMKKNKSEANFQSNGQRDREREMGRPVEELLYEDAKRRWEKQEIKKKNLERMKEEQIQASKPPVGNNNTRFAAQKFEKEFYYLIHQIMMGMNNGDDEQQQNSEEPNQDFNLREYDDKKLNYVRLGQLLTDLGYISPNIAPDSVERELMFDLWTMLNGEENSGISVLNIKKTLLAIQGICIDAVENPQALQYYASQKPPTTGQRRQESDSHHNRPSSLIAHMFDAETGQLYLSQSETQKIFVKFKPYYVNRVHFLGQFKRVKHVDNACTFKPQISEASEQLAKQRRARLLSREGNSSRRGTEHYTHEETQEQHDAASQQNTTSAADPAKVDIVQLLLHPAHTDKQWQQQAKSILEQRELEECTFKPKINDYQGENMQRSRLTITGDKCIDLYLMAKPAKEKRDKTRDDYEFEKAQDECTFQPNVKETQRNAEQLYFSSSNIMAVQDSHIFLGSEAGLLNQSSTQNIKGYQLMMNRMQKGREDREKVKSMTQRGIPGTVTDESQLKPIHIESNQNYKGAFSTFSHYPDQNIHVSGSGGAQSTQANNTSVMNRSRLANSKSNSSLHLQTSQLNETSISRKQQKVQLMNQSNDYQTTMQVHQPKEKENSFQHPAVFQSQQDNSKKQSYGPQGTHLPASMTTSNTRVGSALSQTTLANKHQTPNALGLNQNLLNSHHNQQQSHPFQSQTGRSSRFSNQHQDSSYEDGGKKSISQSLAMGQGYQNLPSDTDPDHSVISKAPSIKQPLLYVDVNLGPGKSERIVVYEGDTADNLAEKFAVSHGLDMSMKGKLAQLLDSQIAGLLEKIEEEQNSIHSDNL